jgi:hypothetical protein
MPSTHTPQRTKRSPETVSRRAQGPHKPSLAHFRIRRPTLQQVHRCSSHGASYRVPHAQPGGHLWSKST